MALIPAQRHLFEIPDDITYLNCAYMSPQLRAVTEVGLEGVRRKVSPWRVRATDFFDEVDLVRTLFARLIGADDDGVALMPAVSYGIATAAANLPLGQGERVLILAEQFPSNVYVWHTTARRAGAEVVTVARPEDGDWASAVERILDERVRIVAVPNCHWTDGSVVDLTRVSDLARAVGAALVVDATQSLGAMPFDVGAVRPDVIVASAYKWLLGPYSMAYAWFAPRWRDGEPIEQSWLTREGSVDFARLVDYRDGYREGARRFDGGQTANFALMPMARASLEQILGWGVGAVADSLRGLTTLLADEATAIGVGVPPPHARAPHMIGLNLPSGVPSDLPERLAQRNIFVSVRGRSIRVSPHLYNDEGDIKRLVEQLAS
jgi:selenocysteine lyase/cysteine desulfurase